MGEGVIPGQLTGRTQCSEGHGCFQVRETARGLQVLQKSNGATPFRATSQERRWPGEGAHAPASSAPDLALTIRHLKSSVSWENL